MDACEDAVTIETCMQHNEECLHRHCREDSSGHSGVTSVSQRPTRRLRREALTTFWQGLDHVRQNPFMAH